MDSLVVRVCGACVRESCEDIKCEWYKRERERVGEVDVLEGVWSYRVSAIWRIRKE
mgnify:CR=1 FL=1